MKTPKTPAVEKRGRKAAFANKIEECVAKGYEVVFTSHPLQGICVIVRNRRLHEQSEGGTTHYFRGPVSLNGLESAVDWFEEER